MHALHPQPRMLLAATLTIACLAFALMLPAQLSGIDLRIGGGSGAERTGTPPPAQSVAAPTPTGARWTFGYGLRSPLAIVERAVGRVRASRPVAGAIGAEAADRVGGLDRPSARRGVPVARAGPADHSGAP